MSQTVSNLHNWHHDDYEEAKAQIHQQLGDISGLEVFGRQVLVGLYIRPEKTAKGAFVTQNAQREDIYQGKIALILAVGPSAFQGDSEYHESLWGVDIRPPAVGDWVILRAQDGLPTSVQGDNASRAQGPDHRGMPTDIYGWEGWPCRYVMDSALIGRVHKPHQVV